MIPEILILTMFATLGEPFCRLQNPNCKNYKKCNNIDFSCNKSEECFNYDTLVNYCSPCNATYFGQVGHTYELKIKRPSKNKFPLLCHLNFTAGGGIFGDLVQINFESFSVGNFKSFSTDGCPNGYLTINELDRPNNKGKWCGSVWGHAVYYSETSSVNVSLFLKHSSEQNYEDSEFEFKISYKFLRSKEAQLRYGNFTQKLYRGKLKKNTYCDRFFEGCSRRPCRIQSPNYPGIYPRNITCYFRIKEKQPPPGKHALISIRKIKNRNKDDGNFKLETGDNFRLWDRCEVMEELIEIRDGFSQNASLLAQFCSTDFIPEIISSGPEVLVIFKTSPYGNPFQPLHLSQLPGFEFEIKVFYVDEKSSLYIEDKNKCEFTVTPIDNTSGFLQSPRHSLPPNTTCRYYFKGQKHEVIWITFIKYYVAGEKVDNDDCNVELQLWNGNLEKMETSKQKFLISRFCKDDKPKLCDHSLLRNSTRSTRPCELHESYISSGPELTLIFANRYGNVLLPVQFLLKYEFVDLFQEGYNMTYTCDRVFVEGSGKFSSPKTIFLYGRGGRQSLQCSYVFEVPKHHELKLTFIKGTFGNNTCSMYKENERDVRRCQRALATLEIIEYPWQDVSVSTWCTCQNFTSQLNFTSRAVQKVVAVFTIDNMSITDDFNNYNFEGYFNFEPVEIDYCSNSKKTRRLHGKSGEITIRVIETNDTKNKCVNLPWLIEPSDSYKNFLYLKVRGLKIENSSQCWTENRILIYSPLHPEDLHVICPSQASEESGFVELFSIGWFSMDSVFKQTQRSKSFIVEFLQKEPGEFVVNWMEVSRNPALSLSNSLFLMKKDECLYSCPELGACISPELWCDGLAHCPLGSDEHAVNCTMNKKKYVIQLLTSSTFLAAVLTIVFILVILLLWKRWKREKKTTITSVMTGHTFFDFKTGFC